MYRPGVLRLVVVLAVAACGDNLAYRFDDLVQVSGGSPFPLECNGGVQRGMVFVAAEIEPSLAIDPIDPAHLAAAWQQDRWSNGGANAIGFAESADDGHTWTSTFPPFSHCAGGDFERTSDPWVSIAPDGTIYTLAISFDATTDRSAVLVDSSRDGMTILQLDDDPDIFNDKDAITAAPDGRVYAVWDRLTGLTMPTKPIGTGPTMLARRTADGWEPARPIYDPGMDAQTIGNQIAVLPDGTLVDVFDLITKTSSDNPDATVAVVVSHDHGDTWSPPIQLGAVSANGVADPKHGIGVRTAAGLPQIAADPATGALYVTWEDNSFSHGDHDGIVVVRSNDGGMTWSLGMQANGAHDVPAFTPSIAVAGDGVVGVLYYDVRDDNPAETGAFRATAWLATSHDGGATWSDERLTDGFDLTPAKLGGGYFLGDYEGLVGRANDFAPLFGVAFIGNDPTDIFIRP